MHPGQFTLLNAPDPAIKAAALRELGYHVTFLDSLGLGPEHKIVLHIGGAYGDRPRSFERFIEAVLAPAASPEALAILSAKKQMRVLIDPSRPAGTVASALDLRGIVGGLLVQERDRVVEAGAAWPLEGGDGLRVVTRRAPTAEEWEALRFAWRITAHVKSNAVIFTAADRTLAIGAGQMSRVDAVRTAVMKAASRAGADPTAPLAGSVAGSDAFFPFRDGLDAVADAGATAVVQPGGSVRDAEVIAAADERGLAMVFTGRRHFRH